MRKVIADHVVEDIYYPIEGNYIIQLKSPVDIPPVKPGNFAQLLIKPVEKEFAKISECNHTDIQLVSSVKFCKPQYTSLRGKPVFYGFNNSPGVFLRRPFSILNVDYQKRIISFYVKIIGKGTRQLGKYKKGDKVNAIYPLGNSFSIPGQGKKALLIGGGSGIAPFILLGKELKKNNIRTTFILGGKSKKNILLTEEFKKYGKVFCTTEDGSLGEKGLVTDHSIFQSAPFDFDRICTCGPEQMMKAIGKIARQRSINCEVSLENKMACGFGACLCCVTETVEGNKRVCMEGPVFNVNYLKWQI